MLALLLTAAILVLLLAMLLAPVEALGLWAGWYRGDPKPRRSAGVPTLESYGAEGEPRHFVVFLDGIAKVGEDNYQDVRTLLANLSWRLPDAVVLGDVMPYSVHYRGLLHDRLLSPFWRFAFRMKKEGRMPWINALINLRNLLQVLVAMDSRYGPLYGHGQAQLVLDSLVQSGYRPGSGAPVTLIGYSGGAQIALVTAPFLKRVLGAPMALISLAGVMASNPALDEFTHVWHVQGRNDSVPDILAVLSAGRWALFRRSPWNRMVRGDRYTRVASAARRHSGPGSYLDGNTRPDGVNTLEDTTELLAGLIARTGGGAD